MVEMTKFHEINVITDYITHVNDILNVKNCVKDFTISQEVLITMLVITSIVINIQR